MRMSAGCQGVDWPLTALAVAFLIAYAWSVLDTTLSPLGRDLLEVLLTGTWVVFGIDYAVRIALAHDRRRFVLTHLLDLAILLLPMLRQLRALRVITVISVLNRQLRNDVRGQVVAYVVGTVALAPGQTHYLSLQRVGRNGGASADLATYREVSAAQPATARVQPSSSRRSTACTERRSPAGTSASTLARTSGSRARSRTVVRTS